MVGTWGGNWGGKRRSIIRKPPEFFGQIVEGVKHQLAAIEKIEDTSEFIDLGWGNVVLFALVIKPSVSN